MVRCKAIREGAIGEGTDSECRGEEGNSSKDCLSLQIITIRTKDRIETKEETKGENKEALNSLSKNNHIIAKMLFIYILETR